MKRIALVVLLLASAALGQAARYDSTGQSVISLTGVSLLAPAPGASITVCNYPATGGVASGASGACTNVAAVCPDTTASGCTTGAPNNPVIADSLGNFGFWISPGIYQYTICPSSGACRGPYNAWMPAGASLSGGLYVGTASMYDPAGNAIGNRVVSSATDVEGNSVSTYQMTGAGSDYAVPNVFRLGINPSTNSSSAHIGLNSEVWTPLANSVNYTGPNYAADFSYVHFGSGHQALIQGSASEAHVGGSGTVDVVIGASGTALCGGATAGWPPQTPTNTGNCGTLRAISSSVTNLTANKVTIAEALFAGPIINTGGGGFGTAYGLHVSDISGSGADVQYQSYFEGAGVNRFQGQLFVNGASEFVGNIGLGTPAIAPTQLEVRGTNLTGVTQTGIQSAPITTSAAITEGIGITSRADLAAAAFNQAANYSFYADDAIKGAGSSITNSYGFYAKLRTSGGSNFGYFSESGSVDSFGAGVFKNSLKVGASGSTITDSRELVQNAHSCGTTTTCANTANGSNRMIFGTVALSAGSAVVGSMTAWASTTSYVCTGTDQTAAAAVKIVNTSTTSITITGTTTDVIGYICIGN